VNDNEAVVRIVGDASGVAPAVSQTKGEVGGLKSFIDECKESFNKAFGDGFRDAMLRDSNAVRELNSDVKRLHATTEEHASGVRGLVGRVHEGVEGFNKFKGAIAATAEAYVAFFAVDKIKEWASELGEIAEKTEHLSQQLGMPVKNVQALQAAAAATDLPFEKLTQAVGLLDRKLDADPKLFKQLGIEIPRNADQMQILTAVAEKFSTTADGPQKVAMALQLMGRNGAQMIPFLNMGAKGLQELTEKAEEYGAVNERAVERGVKLADAVDESHIAYMGLTQTLTDAFAPILTEIVERFNEWVVALTKSYNEGGAAKVVFDGIVAAFEGFGEIINAVGEGLAEMFSSSSTDAADWSSSIQTAVDFVVTCVKLVIAVFVAMHKGVKIALEEVIGHVIGWYGSTKEFFDKVGVVIEVMKMYFKTLGVVVYDALSLRWTSIAGDWDAGMAQIQNVVKTRGAQIVAEAKATSDQSRAWLNAAAADNKSLVAYMANALNPTAKPPKTEIPKPKEEKTFGTLGGGGGGGGKSGAGAKPKDDLVQKLEQELTAKKLAWEREQDAQNTAIAYSLQAEADYWAEVLKRTDLSSKDRAAIEAKYLAIRKQQRAEQWSTEEEGYKRDLEAAGSNTSRKLELAAAHLRDVSRMYGEESRQFRQAQDDMTRIQREADQQRIEIERQRAEAQRRIREGEIDDERDLARFRVQMGLESEQQLLAQERQFEVQRFALERANAVSDRSKLDPAKDPAKYAQLTQNIEAIERNHQSRLDQIDRAAILARTALQRQAINSTASLWGQNIAKLVTLQQSFATTVQSIYRGMVSILSDALASIIEKWLVKHLSALIIGGTESKLAAVGQIANNAAVAGSAAWASTAAIPIIGPELAPAAAATAYAGAMGFMASLVIPSGAGGIWEVPGGLTMLHENEMVLPAWAASPLRSMISGGAANLNAPAPANDAPRGGGDTFHIHTMDARGVRKFLMDHHAAVGDAVRHNVRNGGKRTT